jgi:mono/diheme cytochrome c family protein
MLPMTASLRRLAALLLLPLFAACGGDSTPATDGAASPPPEPAPVADATETPEASATVASNARGEAVYSVNCVSCHQPNGQGMPAVFPPLAGSEWVTGPVERPIAIVMHGLQGPITVAGNSYSGMMTPWGVGAPLNDEDLAAVVSYIRSSWGNSASPATVEDVARVRTATADRKAMWTAEEVQKAFP